MAHKLNYSPAKIPFLPPNRQYLGIFPGQKRNVTSLTQLSGITAVHPVQNSDSGAAPLRVSSRLWSSLHRTTGPLDSSRRLPLLHARSPTLRAPSLRSSSGGFEQLRPSSGRLHSEPLGSTLFAFVVHFAVHPLPRSEPNAFDDGLRHRAKVANAFDDGLRHRAKVASPTV